MGIPVASICTSIFLKEAKNSAHLLKMPDFRVVEITHPLSTLTDEEIRGRAIEAAVQVVEIITGENSDKLADLSKLKESLPDFNVTQHIQPQSKEIVQTVEGCADG